tara:strand:+ start:133 stop:615 length:483 start_codon:yes stop_codon:yes gene_type:complete
MAAPAAMDIAPSPARTQPIMNLVELGMSKFPDLFSVAQKPSDAIPRSGEKLLRLCEAGTNWNQNGLKTHDRSDASSRSDEAPDALGKPPERFLLTSDWDVTNRQFRATSQHACIALSGSPRCFWEPREFDRQRLAILKAAFAPRAALCGFSTWDFPLSSK